MQAIYRYGSFTMALMLQGSVQLQKRWHVPHNGSHRGLWASAVPHLAHRRR